MHETKKRAKGLDRKGKLASRSISQIEINYLGKIARINKYIPVN